MTRDESALPFLNKFAAGYRRLFISAILASAVSIVASFLTPQVIRFTVDFVIGEESAALPAMQWILDAFGGRELLRANLIFCALGIVICSLISGIFNYFSRVSIAKFTEGVTKKLRDTLFSHVQHLPFKWHTETQAGDIIQRCTSDVETLRDFVSSQLIEVIRTLILVSAALIIMFSMNLTLALVTAAFIPLILGYSLFFLKRISTQFRMADEAEGVLMTGIQENLSGVRVVRAFGREEYEKAQFEKKLNFFTKKWVDLGYTLGVYWGVGDFVTAGQILAVVCVGSYLAAKGSLTLGELLAFISYTYTISWPVRSLGRTLSELSKAGVSSSRLRDILDAKAEEDEPGAKKERLDEDIVFKNVSFSYGEKPVLDNLSFTVRKGTVFGILGATGSGKSTIAGLLNRLYELPPDKGDIYIGETNIRHMDRAHLRSGIGLVLQEPFLYSKTVRENIEIAVDGATLETVRKNADIASVDASIMEFREGYDTIVGERGVTLSGGQKQRIAIARALMMGCPILIFDDSTSAVDMETDERIWRNIRQTIAGKTVIIISHRVSTLMRCDNIMVLENGSASELGTHGELIAREGVYHRIYKMQSEAVLLEKEEGARNA